MGIAMTVPEERRLFSRLQFEDKALVVAKDVVGLVRDVSLGGISFSYYGNEGKSLGSKGFDIVSGSGVFSVLPGDYALMPEPNDALENRRPGCLLCCRVHFLNISASQLAGLWSFLKEYCQPGIDNSHVVIDGAIISFSEIEAFVSANRKNVFPKRDMFSFPYYNNIEQVRDYECLQKTTSVVA